MNHPNDTSQHATHLCLERGIRSGEHYVCYYHQDHLGDHSWQVQPDTSQGDAVEKEVWLPVIGYEKHYEVSNFGNIRSLKRPTTSGKVLKQSTRFREYQCVTLSKFNVQTMHNTHRLVATAFIPNPFNKRTVNHIDGNPKNNYVDNLEWATYSENEQHSHRVLGKETWNKGRLGLPANITRSVAALRESVGDA